MSFDNFKILEGGLAVSVLQMDITNPSHESVLGKALKDAIEFEAKAHDTESDNTRFDKILAAAKANRIQAWFMIAGWENCAHKVLAAAIDFPTVMTKWDGKEFKHYPAKYREDTCLLPNILRKLIAQRPDHKFFPEQIGLGEYFEQETMRIMATQDPSGLIYRGRVAEYSSHSVKMVKLMGQIGAGLGKKEDGTILELNGSTPEIRDRWKVEVETEILTQGAEILPYVFVTNWSSPDGKQRISASFTQGISSFTGDAVTRVQFTSNKNLPNEEVLKDVLASLLSAGEDEIQNRQWGAPNPSANGNLFNGINAAPIMRVHTLNEPEIALALRTAPTRSLGFHPMLPVALDLATIPENIMPFTPKVAKPHKIIRPVTNRPYFNLDLAA